MKRRSSGVGERSWSNLGESQRREVPAAQLTDTRGAGKKKIKVVEEGPELQQKEACCSLLSRNWVRHVGGLRGQKLLRGRSGLPSRR